MIKKSTYQENWQKIRNVFIVAGLPWIILLISILLPDYGGNNTLYALIIIMLIWIVMAFVGLKNMFSYVGDTIKNAKDDQNVIKKIYTFRGKPIDILMPLVMVVQKIRRYFYIKNFDKRHLTFGFVKGKFKITSTSHNDFITVTQKKIDKLAKKYSREKFIKLALTESLEGCNFIIFSHKGDGNKFVQYWTGEHELKYNFFANKVNKLKNCFLSIVGLLSELGFVNDTIPEYKGLMVFKIDKGTDYISVDANFRKDIDLATEFTEIIFKQIYKIGNKKLIAKVE